MAPGAAGSARTAEADALLADGSESGAAFRTTVGSTVARVACASAALAAVVFLAVALSTKASSPASGEQLLHARVQLQAETEAAAMITTGTSGGVASASSTGSWGSDVSVVFDGANDVFWHSGSSTMPEWVEYVFLAPQVVSAFEITGRADYLVVADSPMDFTLAASNGGESSYTILDSWAGVADWVAHSPRRFDVPSPAAYLQYRLDVSATGGRDGVMWLVLTEITFYGVQGNNRSCVGNSGFGGCDTAALWDAGFGGCDTYGPHGSNKHYCDSDNCQGIVAKDVCAQCGYCAGAPPDSCIGATDLSKYPIHSYHGTTVPGMDTPTTSCGGLGNEKIFYIDVPSGHTLTIGMSNSDYDSIHETRWGGACPGVNRVSCTDDPDTTQHVWHNEQGTVERAYFIIDAYSTKPSNFILTWNISYEATQDSCSEATDLSTVSSPYYGTTVTGMNTHTTSCGGSGNEQIMYIDVPPGANLTIGMSSNDYDSRHETRWGGACPGVNLVECTDDPDELQHVWHNEQGTVQRAYFIIDAYSSGAGHFTLTWNISDEATQETKSDCVGDHTSWDGGDGGCDTYGPGEHNNGYCASDYQSDNSNGFNHSYAKDVCYQCGSCVLASPTPE